jgi:hypothetical protein
MKTRQLTVVAAFCVLALGSAGAVAQCRTVPAPGGGFMTECPSEAPPPPPAFSQAPPAAPMPPAPGGIYRAVCVTPRGNCTVIFSTPPSHGDDCTCQDTSGGEVPGWTAAR